jgi:hypothetical protein
MPCAAAAYDAARWFPGRRGQRASAYVDYGSELRDSAVLALPPPIPATARG